MNFPQFIQLNSEMKNQGFEKKSQYSKKNRILFLSLIVPDHSLKWRRDYLEGKRK